MEYRCLYDKNGNITGEKILKDEKYPTDRRIQVTAIIIENSDEKLLVQKRSKSKKGTWGFTSGHIENDESGISAIIREVKEELGFNLDKKRIITFETGVNEKYVFNIYYTKENIELERLKLQIEEVESVKWLSLNEIKDLINNGLFTKSHIDIFNNYLKCFDKSI